MQLLFVAATPFEIAPLIEHLDLCFDHPNDFRYTAQDLEIQVLITGVGSAYTAYCMGQMLSRQQFDLVINAGIAGAINPKLKIGDVVNIISERFADLGVEEADGSFSDMHELGLIAPEQMPFENGILRNPGAADFAFLPACKGLTVNKVHGFQPSIEALKKKYEDEVETMEGAAFFLSCLMAKQPFLEIRAISNYVETRNRERWDLPLAIGNLNAILIEMIGSFVQY
jgi:futalosine hydrolase